MKKSKEFLRKLAVITLSCISLLQFTSVFADGPGNQNSNSTMGKSPLSVFRASEPSYYEVIPNSPKPPRPTHSQKKEQILTPKKSAKKPPEKPTEQIRP